MLAVAAACGAEERGAGGTSTGSSEPPSAPTPDSSETLYETSTTVLDDGEKGAMLCLGGVLLSLPPQCGTVPVPNWDWAAVNGEESLSGTTWGAYHVVGTYDADGFTVTQVGAYDPEEENLGSDRDLTTPCPEPEGGWVAGDPSRVSAEDFDGGASVARSQPDFVTLWVDYVGDFTPEELDQMAVEGDPALQIMNVVVTGDEAAPEAAIRELWGGPLCIAQREGYTEKELRAIRKEAERFLRDELGLEMTWSQEGDVGLAAEIGVVVDVDGAGQAALDERYGAGMVRLLPALRPVE